MTNQSQKVILITGTSSGFGKLSAKQLADQGNIVYASMRGVAGKNSAVAADLSAYHDNIHVVEMDVTKADDITSVITQITSEQGRIDVVVNNAGLMNVGVCEAYTDQQQYAQMEVNYFGPMRLFRAALPHMRDKKSGLFITITSLAGRMIFPAFTTYNASKYAVEALAEGYRYELAPFQVDSVIIEPGPFKTELINNSPKPDDAAVSKSYGDHGVRLNSVLDGFADFYEQEGEGLANPQIVVDDIIKLINTPFGQRPIRTVSGVDYGIRDLNKTSAQYQKGIISALGMDDLAHDIDKA